MSTPKNRAPVDLSQSFDMTEPAHPPTGKALAPRVEQETLPAAVAGTDAASLVRLALETNADVEKLERLVALLERSQERNARAAYFEALAKFQAECPPIRKTSKASIATRSGGSYSYDYADLGEIANTIRPGLLKYGFSYTFDAEMGGPGILVIGCTLRHVEGHAERSTFPVPIDTEAKMSGAQKNGAALTYGRRQTLLSVTGLVAVDKDTDGAAGNPQPVVAQPTEEEVEDLVQRVGREFKTPSRFWEWLGAGPDNLTGVFYKRAVDELNRRQAARQEGNP